MSPNRRVILVDVSRAPSFGGSKRVLCNLALGLRDRGWDPRPVFQSEGPFLSLLRGEGIPATLVVDGRPWTSGADGGAPRGSLSLEEGAAVRSARSNGRSWRARFGTRVAPDGTLQRAPWRRAMLDLRSWTWWGISHAVRSRTLRRLLEPRPALIHVNAPCHRDYVWVQAARLAGIPYFTHEHGVWEVLPPAAFRRVAREASGVFCLTEERVRQVREFAGASAHPVHLPNGIDPATFVARRSREAVRAELGVGADDFLLLTPGHIQPWKGQAVVPEAARELRAAGVSFTWLLCGTALRPAYADAILARLRSLGLDDRVRFLGHRDDMPDLFAAADLTVHTTLLPEPFGLVLIESMVVGTPVVGARAGAVPEIVRDGIEGLLYEPGDVSALVGAIRAVIGSPEARRRMSASARERARAHFHIDRQVDRLLACYETALAARSGRGGASIG